MQRQRLKFSILLCLLGSAIVNAQAPYSTPYSYVTGIVWKETLPTNDIMDSGEENIAGMLITLKDASTGEIISSSVSGSNGKFSLQNRRGPGSYYIEYTYPTAGFTLVAQRAGGDDLINSAADPSTNSSDAIIVTSNDTINGFNLGLIPTSNTITYCDSKDFTVTIWNTTFSLPQLNIPGDSLTKATLFAADAVLHPKIGIENTGSQSADVDLGFAGRLAINMPTGSNLITATAVNKEISLGSWDGNTDYDGTSGHTWYDLFSSATNSRTMTSPPQLIPYTGSGMVNFPTQAKSTTSITGSGNMVSNVETYVSAGVCITYQYIVNAPLPVSLKNISASTDGVHSFITWTTATEYYNKGFAIERSMDGRNFKEIDFVKSLATDGISTTELTYNCTDQHPVAGTNLYRLKQINIDGRSVYSKTLSVDILNEAALNLFPNPGHDFITINSKKEDKSTIFDTNGNILNVPATALDNQKIIHINELPNGNYFLKVTNANGVKTSKFVVLH